MRNYRRFCAVLLLLTLLCGCAAEKAVTTVSLPGETNAAAETEPHPVKRTEKKYKVFPVSSRVLLAVFYAARQSACFSIGVSTPRLR